MATTPVVQSKFLLLALEIRNDVYKIIVEDSCVHLEATLRRKTEVERRADRRADPLIGRGGSMRMTELRLPVVGLIKASYSDADMTSLLTVNKQVSEEFNSLLRATPKTLFASCCQVAPEALFKAFVEFIDKPGPPSESLAAHTSCVKSITIDVNDVRCVAVISQRKGRLLRLNCGSKALKQYVTQHPEMEMLSIRCTTVYYGKQGQRYAEATQVEDFTREEYMNPELVTD